MPPLAVRQRFAAIIDELSRQFGTPRFEPHLTLASGDGTEADVIARTTALASQLQAIPIQLTHAGYTEHYFRCLFVYADRNAPLLDAHRLAAEYVFARPVDDDFMPHLSLVYGKLSIDEKEKILDRYSREFDIAFSADTLTVCAPDGDPSMWRLLGPFALAGNN
ncbi:MAG: 2'-5' RNA ligase family protein [Gammaproteobacteria bacterium]|nr:2'-5' RNA ligase family protein [Gammaproteobacteria bacterium]